MLKGTYVHQMSCTRKDFPTKISLKMHFWKDLRGVLKNAAKRDNEGAVCNSGIGMLFFMYLICLHYFFNGGGGVKKIFYT